MLPEAFLERMKRQLGDEYESYLDSLNRSRAVALRFNPLKGEIPQLPFVGQPVPWEPMGYYYDPDARPGLHAFHEAGVYYLQEASAMAPVALLDPQPGERVCDLCAAPGGKTTQIAGRMMGQGFLLCNEINPKRAKILSRNIERMAVSNALVTNEHPATLAQRFAGFFDRVLVDAPCSGEGMFRKDRKMVKAWEEHGPEFFSNIQKSLILQAARMLKPGGMMLYSTCTFDERENEQIIAHLLGTYPEFQILPIEPYEGFASGRKECVQGDVQGIQDTVRIFPHRMKGEGHYLALLRKGDEKAEEERRTEAERRRPLQTQRKKARLPEDFQEFWQHVTRPLHEERIEIRGDKLYEMPEGLPDIRGLRFLRTGLLLGELKKNRFEPSQALAMNLKKEDYDACIDLPAEDERVLRYLKGETLEVEDLIGEKAKGWYLVCVDGFPLGFGKAGRGTLKNKYLPGWRLMG